MKFSFYLFLTILLFAVFAPVFSPYSPTSIQLQEQNLAPSFAHWFGTDELGRDLFIRIAYGIRISLFIGLAAALIDSLIGILWGGICAKYEKLDPYLTSIFDIFSSIPSLLLCLFLTSILGNGTATILLAMTCTGWVPMARIVRGEVLHLKQAEFILAAKAIGASSSHIFFRHFLPNAIGPIITTLTLTIPLAIFTEAFLSFLGMGVIVPLPSLGIMVSDGAAAMLYYPWRLFFPAFFLSSLILSLNLIGTFLQKKFQIKEQIHA